MRLTQTIAFLFVTLAAQSAGAQTTFTDYLTLHKEGEGRVTLHQDDEITALVNGERRHTPAPAAPQQQRTQPAEKPQQGEVKNDTPDDPPSVFERRVRVNGYRIQVYAGGNDRKAKQEAERVANQVRSTLPELRVYANFINPRWVCRVGDFTSYQDASTMLQELRQSGHFPNAIIVKTQVFVYR